VIFIEINVDKIINAFTKSFFVNVVNVYHIYDNIIKEYGLNNITKTCTVVFYILDFCSVLSDHRPIVLFVSFCLFHFYTHSCVNKYNHLFESGTKPIKQE